MNLFLIGYRGSGKTTVAQHLALLLGWPWVDADVLLEQRADKSIKQIFAERGEAAFRDLEAAIVADLAAQDRHVVALGGGAILREQNRQAIAGRGAVVWLQASAKTLLHRINADPTTGDRRPNLTAQGGLAEIQALLSEREPIYRQCATLIVDAEQLAPEIIAHKIVASLAERETA
ncbi:MAG: shikimate kinase [Pirellulaceae bacterium]